MNIRSSSHTYKKRIFTYIIILSIIPIAILGLYSYKTYEDGITSNVKVSTRATVSQVKVKVDTVFNNIRKSYLQAADDNAIQWFLNEEVKYSDYSNLVELGDVLLGPSFYSHFIEGYSFINFKSNWVLSNRGMYPYDLVSNKEEVDSVVNYTGTYQITDYWVSNLTEDKSILSREEINLRNLSLILKVPLIKKNPHGMIVINMNMPNLEEFIKQDIGDNGITILNKDGDIIFTSDKEFALSLSNYYTSIQEQGSKFLESSSFQTDSKDTHYISVSESNAMDFYYVANYNKERIKDGSNSILSLTMIVLLICILVIVVALLLTNRLYNPIKKLTNYVDSINDGRDKNDNELEAIAHGIDNLKSKKDILENKINSQLPQLMELFQIRLLRGELKDAEINSYLESFRLNAPIKYMIMAIHIRTEDSIEGYDEAKQDALRMDIVENMPSHMKELLYLQAICNAKTIVCTIASMEDDELDEKILILYEKIESYIRQEYDMSINIGVSSAKDSLMKFPYAYQESITALKNNDLFANQLEDDHHQIMFYGDVSKINEGYQYDNLLERELKEAIDLGDKDKAYEYVDRIIDTMIAHNVTPQEVTLNLHRVLIAIILVAYNAGLQVNDIFEEGFSDTLQKYSQLYNMNQIRSYLKLQVIVPIIQKLELYRTSKSGEIMLDIQKIIDTSNGDVSLTECAEKLGYHPTYIWKVMKVEKNTTFSNYVSEYKLEEAKKLLLETDLTVAEIANKLNYTNAQNFIRFFSKLEGTTPGKYRQSGKHSLL